MSSGQRVSPRGTGMMWSNSDLLRFFVSDHHGVSIKFLQGQGTDPNQVCRELGILLYVKLDSHQVYGRMVSLRGYLVILETLIFEEM